MNKRRLKVLARDILPYVEEEHFNMVFWRGKCRNDCGTAACAFGSHVLSPQGAADGLKMRASGYHGERGGYPVYGRYESMDAAAAYYDIPYAVANWLFDPYSYTDDCASSHGLIDDDDYLDLDVVPVLEGDQLGMTRREDRITAAMVAERVETLLASGVKMKSDAIPESMP